ncbi:YbbL ABC transporter ATP-binding protein [hydrothermal vent metagenome]|uniref:YbbL ABC transporter ATP-binding protein n=1 Tax=hydrothermal vent metagenome TaxID=652676 RepID=A0A3B0Z0T8_9ZZZZ
MKFEVRQLESMLAPSLKNPLNLTVKAKEVVCISGESGVGKSVFLRCLADLIPHTGEMKLNGHSSQSMPANDWRRQVCLLPAESQWWFVTVAEHFVHNQDQKEQKTLEGLKDPKDLMVSSNNKSDSVFEQSCFRQLGFSPEVMQWRIDRLSTGEKQRLSLLRVINNKPEVLLLDEPTASLDPITIRKAEACIANYQQETDCSIVWISHDPAQIRRVADRHICLETTGFSERDL